MIPRRPHTHLDGPVRRHRLTGRTHLRGEVAVEAHARRILADHDTRRTERRGDPDR